MNWKKQLSYLTLFSLLWMNVSAQEITPAGADVNYNIQAEDYKFNDELFAYYNEMQTYILENAAEPMPAELKEMIRLAKEDSHDHHFGGAAVTGFIRDYWKDKFLGSKPMPNVDSNLTSRAVGSICDNGGFEDDFTGYDRYRSVFNDHYPKCNPEQNNQPLNWEFLVPNPITYPNDYPNDFNITIPVLDQNIPASFDFYGVRFGRHALQINDILGNSNGECGRGNRGIDKITKVFTVDEAHEQFAIWFANVLQDPDGHQNENHNWKPFFNIKFYDVNDDLVDELCWDSTEDFFIDIPNGQTSCGYERNIRFQPWTCTIFDFTGYEDQELRMDIITADCGLGAHFGYAYIDGICDYCATIDISAAPVECSDLPYAISGVVNIADTDASSLQVILLEGILIGDDGSELIFNINNYNATTGGFGTQIQAAHLSPGVCYDFYVSGTFQNGTDTPFQLRSSTLITGEFNDFCTEDFSQTRLDYTYEVECIDVGHPRNITKDEYKITLDVITSGPNVEWEIIKNGWEVIASGSGNEIVVIGPYKYQDCDYFELRDVLCDKTCFLNIDYNCDDCVNAFRICDHEIICDDRGNSDPTDDQWSIKWVVENEDGAGNWAITEPNFFGNYNEVTTIFMGEINNYGATHSFKVYDPVNRCILRYTVDVPPACRNCNTDFDVLVSDCRPDPNCSNGDYIYYVDLLVPGGVNGCIPQIFMEINDNDYLPLAYHLSSNGMVTMGPFNVGAGPFTILVVDCNGCSQEIVVFPPTCIAHNRSGKLSAGMEMDDGLFEVMPNPTSGLLKLMTLVGEENYNLSLINMLGQPVVQLSDISGDQHLDISKVSAGVYHVVISKDDKIIWTDRIIKSNN